MKKKIVEKLFNSLYPEFSIKTIEILDKNKFENGEWTEDLPAVFVTVSYLNESVKYSDVSNTLTLLTGHEFSVSLV